MEVIKVDEQKEFKEGGLIKKVVTSKEQFCGNLFFIDSGAQIPVHQHSDSEEIFYIIDGEATVILGDESRVATTGSIIHSPTNMWHGIKNESGKRLTIMTVHKPGAAFEKRL